MDRLTVDCDACGDEVVEGILHDCPVGGPVLVTRSEEQMVARDETMPEGKWEFDADVADVFDDMLERSIPQYDVMRRAVTDLGLLYIRERQTILDLGASRGEALVPFIAACGAHNDYVAAEVSEPMLDALRARFAGYREATAWDGLPLVDVREVDLRSAFPVTRYETCVVLAVLTLMFVPPEHRQRVVQHAYDSLVPGGAFLVVEKILGPTSDLDDRFVHVYLESKREAGYTEEQIARKRLALEGVLMPFTAEGNVAMLRGAGFRTVEPFWRWMNFAAWVAVK